MDEKKQSFQVDSKELRKIIAESTEICTRFFNQVIQNQKERPIEITFWQIVQLGNLYSKFMSRAMIHPAKIAESQISYWKDFIELWKKVSSQWLTDKISFNNLNNIDKRFNGEAWNHPVFSFIKEFYFLTANHIQKLVNNVEGLDEKSAKKINFYTSQFIDAMAPSNFITTNPEVLKKTFRTGGKNLVNGFKNMLADLERCGGYLNIKMTDLDAFEIGKNIAITPGKVIFENNLMQLIQYEPITKSVYERPLLIIPPWINKYYILDLSETNSIVRWLVAQGYSVFMISWVNPDKRYAEIDFHHYLLQGTLQAVDAIEQATGANQINAVGYCIGGTLLACTLAYMAERGDQRIKSATYLATLLDFKDAGEMGTIIDDNEIRLLEHEMNKKGYLDGGRMSLTFNMLRANDLIWSYFIKNYLQGEEPFPFDLLYWNSDTTNMPAKMHSFYLRGMYLHNLLTKSGGINLAGVPIDLRKINIPIYSLATHFDHIAPWNAVYSSALLHSGPIDFVLAGSGHIAGVINPPQVGKYCYYTNSDLSQTASDWFKNAKEHTGSWWPNWEAWLQNRSGEKIKARVPGEGQLKVIEDAPGSYVKVKLSDIEKMNKSKLMKEI